MIQLSHLSLVTVTCVVMYFPCFTSRCLTKQMTAVVQVEVSVEVYSDCKELGMIHVVQ